MAEYFKDTTDRILQYLKDNFGDQFHAFFEGDPIHIPQSLFPCIVVSKVSSTIQTGPTGADENTESIIIKVILNKKDDFGNNEVNTNMTERRLRHIVEARDATTLQYVPESIMGALRLNITLGDVVLDESLAVKYGVDLRPDDVITSEAHVTATVRTRILVPQRV